MKLRPQPTSAPNAFRSGFTLIELLVVVAIIAILASLLLPALAKSKLKAIGAACTSNQKQLMLGFTMYDSDWNKMAPSQYAGGYWAGPTPGITAGISEKEARIRVSEGLRRSPLFEYVPSDDVHHCPGDERTKRLKPGYGWAYDSYSKSNAMNGGGWGIKPFTKMSEVIDPADTMAFIEEADPRSYNNGTWVMNVWPSPGWVDPFAIFHGSSSTFAFADGHADDHRWLETSTIKAAKDSAEGRSSFYWAGGTKLNRDFVWVHDKYRHVDFKPLR